jgi:transposase
LVDDRLWELLDPLLPPRPPARGPGGRRPIEDRAAREGIERTASWLLGFKRLGLRYDRTRLTLRPLLTLGCVLINLRRLVRRES